MIRRYCDRCGEQITGRRNGSNRIKRELYESGRIVSVEVMVAFNRTWNSGDVCDNCVILAVNTGQDISDCSSVRYSAVTE